MNTIILQYTENSIQTYFSSWAVEKLIKTIAQADEKAGIHPVTLIKESEAAALYTLADHEQCLKIGDSFLVCDAGGRAVDLITYEIAKLSPSELKEVVPGSGSIGKLHLNVWEILLATNWSVDLRHAEDKSCSSIWETQVLEWCFPVHEDSRKQE